MWPKTKWIILAVVKPLAALWLIASGVPPAVRAIGDAAVKVVRALNAPNARR